MDIEQGWKATPCNYLSAPEIFVMVSSLASITSCLISDASINCFLGKKELVMVLVSIASCLLGRDSEEKRKK